MMPNEYHYDKRERRHASAQHRSLASHEEGSGARQVGIVFATGLLVAEKEALPGVGHD